MHSITVSLIHSNNTFISGADRLDRATAHAYDVSFDAVDITSAWKIKYLSDISYTLVTEMRVYCI